MLLYWSLFILQMLAGVEAPLPSGARLADLLQKHELAGRKAVDYRLFLTGCKYTRKSWRSAFADDDVKATRLKLKASRRRPAPLFICRRPLPAPGSLQSQNDQSWQPPYVQLRLSDVRPINVERPGHVITDDRAWYANR